MPCLWCLDFSAVEMSDDQFVQFCADNRELRIELTAAKELIVMPPANPVSGIQNSALNAKIYNWSILNGSGVSFDSSSGFTSPMAQFGRPTPPGCPGNGGTPSPMMTS